MSLRREAILREIGLGPLWKLRRAAEAAAVPAASAATERLTAPVDTGVMPTVAARSAAIAQMDWRELKASVADCRACGLCQARERTVFGIGDANPDWLFVGEGPGAEEDRKGEPFVGQAGRLLDAMLAAIDLDRRQKVYIANTVKCRPPGNRTPEPDEIAACWPYLARQIDLLAPKLIVALGKPAAQTLLGREVKIGAERGKLHAHHGIPLIVTYHPAYLLRNLTDKAKSWEDLCFARSTLAGICNLQ